MSTENTRPAPSHRDAEPGTPAWSAWVVEWEDYVGHAICGAKNKEARPCVRAPMNGKDRCRKHGGATPAGLESPQYKHGQFVGERKRKRARLQGSLPGNLERAFARAIRDPDLFHQDAWVGLSQARVEELLQHLKNGESTEDQWIQVKCIISEARQKARDIRDQGTDEEMDWEAVIQDISMVVHTHQETVETWELINAQQEQLRKHTETEVKRQKEANNSLPRVAAILFAASLRTIVEEEVDVETWRRIQPRLVQAMANHLGHLMTQGG